MSLKTIATSAAVIASLLATSLPLATSANAGSRWQKYDDRGYARHYDGPRHHHGPRHRYVKRHHNHDKDLARGIAIGLGVLAVGAILSQAHR